MCTRPITITKTYPLIGTKSYTVPCGKCPDCRAKYQSEFAALSLLEAQDAGTLSFYTFTYNDDSLPFAITTVDCDGPHIQEFQRGYNFDSSVRKMQFCVPVDCGDYFATPSICRKDLQLLLKRFREQSFRENGTRLDLRFSAFGEYGEQFQRPHMHMLVYGLSVQDSYKLKELWSYGFVGLEVIQRFNVDGSDAFAKVSRYVSKYVGKKDLLPWFVLQGYAEKPRKQTSLRLGVRNFDKSKYQNFI